MAVETEEEKHQREKREGEQKVEEEKSSSSDLNPPTLEEPHWPPDENIDRDLAERIEKGEQ